MAREHYAAPGPPPPAFEPKGQVRVSLLAGPGVALTAMDEAPNSEDARSTAFLKRGSRIRPGMHMHRFVAQANRSTTRFSTNESATLSRRGGALRQRNASQFPGKIVGTPELDPSAVRFIWRLFRGELRGIHRLCLVKMDGADIYPPSTDGIYSVFQRATITRIV